MTSSLYPHLFSPLPLGTFEVQNRAFMSSITAQLADTVVNERLLAFIGERARGGAGLITLGSAPVHPALHNHDQKQLALYSDEVVPGLARLADTVHAAGSRLAQILWHGGHNQSYRSGYAAVAPSPVPSVVHGGVPKQVSKKELKELRGYYARAARRCADAGLDAVVVQTAADYIIGSFLNPTLNRRTDEYGGSLENRLRFVTEVLEDVREAVDGRCAVAIRTSAGHLIPTDPTGYSRDDALEAVGVIAQKGLVDWVSVLSGSYWSATQIVSPMHHPRTPGADDAAAFKAAGLGVPVFTTGRIRTPEEAEEIIASGKADAVELARTLLADPEWPTKARTGRSAEIRPCISCSQGCWASYMVGAPVTCIVNPAAGYELQLGPVGKAAAAKQVAVVGGGPAGLEAARVAAERGHSVTLYEATAHLGGDMRVAALMPHRGEIMDAVDWWERELARLGVTVRRNTAIESAAELAGADEVIWATGAQPSQTAVLRFRPANHDGIPGAAGLPHGRELLRGEKHVAGSVLVIDEEGGWPAVSLAEWLVEQKGVTKVTVATTAKALGDPDLFMTLEIFEIGPRLAGKGIEVIPDAIALSVENGKANLLGRGEIGPYDAIVLSTGTTAPILGDDDLAAGDCVAPRNIWAATMDAGRIARAL